MSTKNLLQQQHEIIQRSQSSSIGYERGMSAASTRFQSDKQTAESSWKRDKGVIETAWQSDKATTEQLWSRTKTPADGAIHSIREAINSTQGLLNRTRWQDTMLRGTPDALILSSGSSFVEQMTIYQSTAVQASKQIQSVFAAYKPKSWPFVAGACGFSIAGVLLIILTAMLAGFFSNTTRDAVLALTCIFTFISTSLLIYALQYTLSTQRTLAKLRKPYANLLQAALYAEGVYNKQLPNLEVEYQKQLREGQTHYKVSAEQIDQTYQRQLDESQTRYNQTRQQLEQTLRQNVQELRRDIETFTQEAGFSGAEWNASIWKQWQPFTSTLSLTRLCTVTLSSPMGKLPPLPLFVSCPGGENILFKATGAAKSAAIEAIQSFMFRLLATQPSGTLHFTLIDPVALGQNVAGFMQLADYDEALVTSRAWIQPGHIEQQLVDLTEHMGNVIRRYLRGQYRSLEEYRRAGGVAEPDRILVVMDFPINFTLENARRLVNIATNGPRCGVSTVVLVDTKQPMPPGFNLADLEQVSTVIAWNGQQFIWNKKEQVAFTR